MCMDKGNKIWIETLILTVALLLLKYIVCSRVHGAQADECARVCVCAVYRRVVYTSKRNETLAWLRFLIYEYNVIVYFNPSLNALVPLHFTHHLHTYLIEIISAFRN